MTAAETTTIHDRSFAAKLEVRTGRSPQDLADELRGRSRLDETAASIGEPAPAPERIPFIVAVLEAKAAEAAVDPGDSVLAAMGQVA